MIGMNENFGLHRGGFSGAVLGIPIEFEGVSEEAPAPPSLTPSRGVDAGVIVVDAETQEPIEGATVRLNLPDFNRSQTKRTNAEGYAYLSFDDVPVEALFGVKAVATVSADGYSTVEKDILTGIDNNPIELEKGMGIATIGVGVAAAAGLLWLLT